MFERFMALHVEPTGNFPADAQRYLIHSNKLGRDIDRISTTKQCRRKHKRK